MDEDLLAIPGAGVKGELGYWLFVIGYLGGRGAVSFAIRDRHRIDRIDRID